MIFFLYYFQSWQAFLLNTLIGNESQILILNGATITLFNFLWGSLRHGSIRPGT